MDDLFQYLQPFFNVQHFTGQQVAIFGVGAGGSVIADALVKCGITSFALIDYDYLEAPNVARHLCGAAEINRRKVAAVADRLILRNPATIVKTYDLDMTIEQAQVETIVQESALVIGATDNMPTRQFLNYLAIKWARPAVFAGVFEKANGGQIIACDPRQDWPCYLEVKQQLHQIDDRQYRTDIPCPTLTDVRQLKAEPGLGIDIDLVALLAAKISLGLLLGPDNPFFYPPGNYYLWSNTTRSGFWPLPLTGQFFRIGRIQDCPVCCRQELNLPPPHLEEEPCH